MSGIADMEQKVTHRFAGGSRPAGRRRRVVGNNCLFAGETLTVQGSPLHPSSKTNQRRASRMGETWDGWVRVSKMRVSGVQNVCPACGSRECGREKWPACAVRIVRCCPWFLAAGEERIGRIGRIGRMGNEKQCARRLSPATAGRRQSVQNGLL